MNRAPSEPRGVDLSPVTAGRLAGTRAQLAEQIFQRGVQRLPIRVILPDGRRWGRGGPHSPAMTINRRREMFRRIGADANIGFGEAYMAGDWQSSDLVGLLTVLATHMVGSLPPAIQKLRGWTQRVHRAPAGNDIATAHRNVTRHYDLSDEMFALFLDETMTYSAALFSPPEIDLATAQRRKIDAILDDAEVRPGTRLLELGAGWGSLAIRAAARGAEITALTLSRNQLRTARQRVDEAGRTDRVRLLLQDYRQATGRFDAVVSVEMIEAVGERDWPVYFSTIDGLLAPGGRVALQSITMPHERMLVSRHRYTWMNKHIFPGGLIPSVQAIEENLTRHTTLRVMRQRSLGENYARTLQCWRERFRDNGRRLAELGFDRAFQRMWEFYLAYCEAGFRAGYLDVHQMTITRGRESVTRYGRT